MHHHGLVTRLIDHALDEARQRDGALAAVHVRLGALAGTDPDHFREEFEHVLEEFAYGTIALHLDHAPNHPGGIELLSIDVKPGR